MPRPAPLLSLRRPTFAIVACCACSVAGAEPAIGQFELKTLDSVPGEVEFQSQNAWSWGQPRRQVATDDEGELVFDENAVVRQRHALELEAGLTPSLKMRVGIEFEKERFDEPETPAQLNAFDDLQLTELGIELIAVLMPREGDGTGLGFVAEFERAVEDDEPDALVLGPIIEFQSGHWFVAAVPMAVRTLGGRTDDGEQIDDKWDFAYAAQLTRTFSDAWSLALESYGTVERVSDTGHLSESAQVFGDFNQHRAGPIVYYAHEELGLSIGLGLLAGLNRHTPDQTLKLSVEVDF